MEAAVKRQGSRSFPSKCVPKLELGNEGGNDGAAYKSVILSECGESKDLPSFLLLSATMSYVVSYRPSETIRQSGASRTPAGLHLQWGEFPGFRTPG